MCVMSWVKGPDCREGGGVLWAGFLGRWGAGSGDGGRDHPGSVGSEVGAGRSAGSRRLRAWLCNARSGDASCLKKVAAYFAKGAQK